MSYEWSTGAKRSIEEGKRIYANHPEQYTENRMRAFWTDLSKIFPTADDQKKEEAFYHSVYDYWMFGNNLREDFFYNFPEKTDKEKSEYITFRNRFNYFRFLNDQDAEITFKKKYRTYLTFKKWYKRDVIAIEGYKDYELFSEFVDKHPVFFAKPESLGLGIGVHKVDFQRSGGDKHFLFDSLLKESAIVSENNSTWTVDKQLVLEEPIIQSKEMALLHPSSVNMIRLTTVLVDDEVKIVDAWLRVGMCGRNIAAAEVGEIYCGVNLKSGVVETNGYTEFGNVFTHHPDTGIPFKGYSIPKWFDMLELAKELAYVLPSVRYVGWDFALTDNGWVIIEGNENGEFLGQLIYGQPYKKMFEEMIGYKPRGLFDAIASEEN